MKKMIGLVYVLFMFIMTACTEEAFVAHEEGVIVQKETFHMECDVEGFQEITTRSLGDDPYRLKNLWIVVFDKAGFLVEYAKATNLVLAENGHVSFDVTLQSSEESRILHFILGYPSDLKLDFGHESTVISKLSVAYPVDVYWQRKEISALTETTVGQELQNIALVRNFAQIEIKVAEDVKNFKLEGYYLAHVSDSSSIAPFSQGKFVNYQKGEQVKSYNELTNEGYTGFVPFEHVVPFPFNPTFEIAGKPSYLYEHVQSSDQASSFFIILKGIFNRKRTYYRVDLVRYGAGLLTHYNILRNFKYIVTVTNVVGEGQNSPLEAYEKPANNNLSASVLTKKFLNVTDGTSGLYVSFMDTVLVSNDPIYLRYKYLPEVAKPNKTKNEEVKFFWKQGSDGATNNIFDVNQPLVNKRNEGGWGQLTLTPQETPHHAITQSLIIYHEEKGLSREVVFEKRPELKMRLFCYPEKVVPVTGSPVVVRIEIPNQLSKRLFPMKFRMEAQEKDNSSYLMQYISPNPDESIYSILGNSLVPGMTSKKSYHYEKTLSYSDYSNLMTTDDETGKVFECKFITNKNQSASTIYVDNKYFTNQHVSFDNAEPGESTLDMNLRYIEGATSYGMGKPVKVEFKVNQAGNYLFVSPNKTLSFEGLTNELSDGNAHLFTVTEPGVHYINCTTTDKTLPLQLKVSREGQSADYVYLSSKERSIRMIAKFTKNQNTYGIGQKVSFDFTTEVAGDYQLISPNGNLAFTSLEAGYTGASLNASTGILTVTSPGKFTIHCTTLKRKDPAQVTIRYVSDESQELTITEKVRFLNLNVDYVDLNSQTIYGEDRPVKLTFTTEQEGTYRFNSIPLGTNTPLLKFVNIKGEAAAVATSEGDEINVITPGKFIIEATTTTWSERAYAQLIYKEDETQYGDKSGVARNQWFVKIDPTKVSGSKPDTESWSVSLCVGGEDTGIKRKWSEWKEGGLVTRDNLLLEDKISFSYQISFWGGGTLFYETEEITVEEFENGTWLNFVQIK